MKLLLVCTGKIAKAAPKDGSPTIRLHCSGTRLDLAGDKVTEELLQSMLSQLEAGTVTLLENHSSTFPIGRSFGGEITQETGSLELYADFWLDTTHPMTNTIVNQINSGYSAQCSIGLKGEGMRTIAYDNDEQRLVGFLRSGEFEHLAFTRPNDAAYPYASVEAITVKSLEAARGQLKQYLKENNKMTTLKEKLALTLRKAHDWRDKIKKDSEVARKDDITMAVKGAHEHLAALKAMGEEVMSNADASPDDLRAFLQHIISENEMIAEVLEQYMEQGTPAAAPVVDEGLEMSIKNAEAEYAAKRAEADATRKEADSCKADEAAFKVKDAEATQKAADAEMSLKGLEEMRAKAPMPPVAGGHASPASPGAPKSEAAPLGAAPVTAGTPAGDKAHLPQPEQPATPATADPASTKPPESGKEDGGDGPAKLTLTFKSMLDEQAKQFQKQIDDAHKLNKAMDERLKKFEAIPDLRNAPGRNSLSPTHGLSGERVLKNLNPATRDEVSRGMLTQAVMEALGGMNK